MCIDEKEMKIYLIGGWDGRQDLADYWEYDIATKKWICHSEDISLSGGPSARSCHKICLDPVYKRIYMMGRYVDAETKESSNILPDFYCFEISSSQWIKISDDTFVSRYGSSERAYGTILLTKSNLKLYLIKRGTEVLS